MDAVFQDITDWLLVQPLWVIYLSFFVISYMENVFPPIPGDLFVVFGGYLYYVEVVEVLNLIWITTLGSVLGFMTLYAYGRYWGEEIKSSQQKIKILRYYAIKYYDKVERWMNRWGQGLIIANRFLTGTRTVISLLAGVSNTNVLYTVVSATLSSLIFNILLITVGWWVSDQWTIIGHYLDMYGLMILSLTVILIAAIWCYKRFKKPKK